MQNQPFEVNQVYNLDALTFLQGLPDESVNCIVTSPPYFGLRDYGVDGQLGLEATPEAYVEALVGVFREARRVLRSDGTLWLNLGDSYAADSKWGGSTGGKHVEALHGNTAVGRTKRTTGLPDKNLLMIPARVALALQADGWLLRSVIIWEKPNCMPESVTDRPTTSHEYVYLFAKTGKYYYDAEAIKEPAIGEKGNRKEFRGGGSYTNGNSFNNSATRPNRTPGNHKNMSVPGRRPHSMHVARITGKNEQLGKRTYSGFNARWDDQAEPLLKRNKRTVWTVATRAFKEAHFATFPTELIEPMVLAGCPETVCSNCGAPHVRVTEREKIDVAEWRPYDGKNAEMDDQAGHKRIQGNLRRLRAAGRDHDNPFPQHFTIGFKPTCTCDAEVRPGRVLDMFGGAGTTALVAQELNRDYLLCELNSEYVEKITRPRLEKALAEKRRRDALPVQLMLDVSP